MSLERKARAYIQAIEAGAGPDEVGAFYHPDVVQHELPNRLNPAGVKRDFAMLAKAGEAGAKVMTRQIYDIHTVTEQGDRVVVEFTWTGYANVPLGMTRAGDPIVAHIVQVLEYEDGLIVRQRTYDCFEPF